MLTRLLDGNDNIVARARAFICAWATRNVGARERVFHQKRRLSSSADDDDREGGEEIQFIKL